MCRQQRNDFARISVLILHLGFETHPAFVSSALEVFSLYSNDLNLPLGFSFGFFLRIVDAGCVDKGWSGATFLCVSKEVDNIVVNYPKQGHLTGPEGRTFPTLL